MTVYRHDEAMQRAFIPKNLIGDSTSDVLRENLNVIGKHLDECEDNGTLLMHDFFLDQCEYLLEDYERVFSLPGTGTDTQRQNKITTGLRARGGLSKQYFEDLGNKQGEGDYTVIITEGTGASGFIVHQYSPLTSPMGPATILPGAVYAGPFDASYYVITVTITGIAGPDKELESMYERLKPAHTKWQYVYVP